MKRSLITTILTGIGIVAAAAQALANDTELTYGGTPKPLNGNTTVSMKSEQVKIIVGERMVKVDCRFTFVNNGPARKVRMGFPDEGGEPFVSYDEKGNPFKRVPSITRFESWVNGKPVKTAAIPAAELGSFWHVKRVDFPAHSTLQVRDAYAVEVGSTAAFMPVSLGLARYVLHTGSSWHGPIQRSEVLVFFNRKRMLGPLSAKRMPHINKRGRPATKLEAEPHTVYYEGPCPPVVSGKTLRFIRTNWRPTKKDDIALYFDLRRRKL